MYTQLINYLKQYATVKPADVLVLEHAFQKLCFKPGQRLSIAGEVMDKLFFINNGVVNIVIPGQEKELVYFFWKQNQFISFLYSLYGNVPAKQGLTAATETEVLFVNKQTLFKAYEQIPYLKELIDQIANNAMADMINVKNSYLGLTSSGRYKLFVRQQPEIALSVPQVQIATYLGITPQSLSRIRRETIKDY